MDFLTLQAVLSQQCIFLVFMELDKIDKILQKLNNYYTYCKQG